MKVKYSRVPVDRVRVNSTGGTRSSRRMSRAWIDAAASAVTFTPSTATKLAPILVEEAPPDAGDEDAPCTKCGGPDSKPGNEIILCDGCDAAWHIICLPRPLACVPDGDWFCPACKPERRFTAADEPDIEIVVGKYLWARDPKMMWGEARVVSLELSEEASVRGAAPAADAPAGSGNGNGSSGDGACGGQGASASGDDVTRANAGCASKPRVVRVRVSYKGFSKKYDEWIRVGDGRLRAHAAGPPHLDAAAFAEEYYVMDTVLDRRYRRGWEYLVAWEGFELRTWEPRSSFVGEGARAKLRAFLEEVAERERVEEARVEAERVAGVAAAAAAAAAAEDDVEDEEDDEDDEDDVDMDEDGATGDATGDATSGGPPHPPMRKLPKLPRLPESRAWIFLTANHPVTDQHTTFVPWLGDDEPDLASDLDLASGLARSKTVGKLALGSGDAAADDDAAIERAERRAERDRSARAPPRALPPGWVAVSNVGARKTWKTYQGPGGLMTRTIKEAWVHHDKASGRGGGSGTRRAVESQPLPKEAEEEEGEDSSHSQMCEACGEEQSRAGNEILLCDGCPRAYHTQCLLPPLLAVPEGDWFCPSCAADAQYDAPSASFPIRQAPRPSAESSADAKPGAGLMPGLMPGRPSPKTARPPGMTTVATALAAPAAPSRLPPLSTGRTILSSLFCRRCLLYDCLLHGTAQPRPRWSYDGDVVSYDGAVVSYEGGAPSATATIALAGTRPQAVRHVSTDATETAPSAEVPAAKHLSSAATGSSRAPLNATEMAPLDPFSSGGVACFLAAANSVSDAREDAGAHHDADAREDAGAHDDADACMAQDCTCDLASSVRWARALLAPHRRAPSTARSRRGRPLDFTAGLGVFTAGRGVVSEATGKGGAEAEAQAKAHAKAEANADAKAEGKAEANADSRLKVKTAEEGDGSEVAGDEDDEVDEDDEGGAGGDGAIDRRSRAARATLPQTVLDRRRKLRDHQERYGTGCDHEGPCDTSTPGCVCLASLNFCEVFCACGPTCKNRYALL